MDDDSSTVAALQLRRIRNADANILQEQCDVVQGISAGHHHHHATRASKRSVENSRKILIVVYFEAWSCGRCSSCRHATTQTAALLRHMREGRVHTRIFSACTVGWGKPVSQPPPDSQTFLLVIDLSLRVLITLSQRWVSVRKKYDGFAQTSIVFGVTRRLCSGSSSWEKNCKDALPCT